jgi:glycosyltransferase involved in cell wall biosynthesis
MDLVVVSLERWDEVWRRNQHLVAGLLATDPGLRVLFVEPAADPLHDLVSRRRPRTGSRLGEIDGIAAGRLWRFGPVKWLPRRLDRRADERLARAVVSAVRRLGMRHPLLWVNDPGMVELAEGTGWPTLYDITDDWVAADRPPGELDRTASNEARLLAVAREVVVCSPELARRKGGARGVELVPNAVDVDAYRRPTVRPGDLPAGPVAVYVGTAHADRLDVGLCEATAAALGDRGTLVLVGPNLLSADDTARLERAGVRLLGPRPGYAVPGYLQHADVLVVPHVVTPFTDSLDPIKLYEYRAVGRPVVSTPVAGFRDEGDARVALAESAAFAAAVRARVPANAAFPEGTDREVASWSDRVAQMRAVLQRPADSAGTARGAAPER